MILLKYKLQKAAHSVKEAKLLSENRLFDTALSRLYYAAFYAVNDDITLDRNH